MFGESGFVGRKELFPRFEPWRFLKSCTSHWDWWQRQPKKKLLCTCILSCMHFFCKFNLIATLLLYILSGILTLVHTRAGSTFERKLQLILKYCKHWVPACSSTEQYFNLAYERSEVHLVWHCTIGCCATTLDMYWRIAVLYYNCTSRKWISLLNVIYILRFASLFQVKLR